jgi:hypothetical protein
MSTIDRNSSQSPGWGGTRPVPGRVIPPTRPNEFPIKAPSSEVAQQAAELHTAWVEQYARVTKIEDDFAAAQSALKQADADLMAALAEAERTGKSGEAVGDAEDAYATAKAAADGPWQQRVAAPAYESEQRRAAYEEYVNEHFDELLAEPELGVEAEAAKGAIIAAAAAMLDGFDRWDNCRSAHAALTVHAQLIDDQRLPQLSAALTSLRKTAGAIVAENGESIPQPSPDERDLRERRYDLGFEERPPTTRSEVAGFH